MFKTIQNTSVITLALLTIAIILVWQLAQIFIIIFGAALFAIFLVHVATILSKYIPFGYIANLVILCLVITIVFVTIFASFTPFIQEQTQLFLNQYQTSLAQLDSLLEKFNAPNLETIKEQVSSSSAVIASQATNIVAATINATSSFLALIVLAFFFALTPTVYVQNVMKLIAPQHKKSIKELGVRLYDTLWHWLIGRLGSMLAVSIITIIGLLILDIPVAIPLGILAGVFCFVPTIGPIVSVVPAMLFALSVSTWSVVYVLLLYIVVQVIEGNIITPFIQQKMVALPPAALLVSQMIFGALCGITGLIFAVPMMLTLFIITDHLYIQKIAK